VQSVLTVNTFQFTATPGGAAVNTTGSGTSVTLTEVPAQLAVDLYLFNASVTPASDNSPFAPTQAEFAGLLGQPIRLQGYTVSGLQAACSSDSIGRVIKAASGSSTIYGVLVNRTASEALSTFARLRLTIAGVLQS